MDVAARVKLKSDRRARALIMALCVLPVATPLVAAGLNVFLTKDGGIGRASAQSSNVHPDRPRLRASLDAPVPLSTALPEIVLSPEPMGAQARLEPAPTSTVARQSVRSPVSVAVARPTGEQVLRDVTVVDGLQLRSEGMVISLAGVGPAPQGSECRRLDGVVEPCSQRAANRLDILTRGRPVICDLQRGDEGSMRGVCRAGKIDLAEDLVRNGLAVRTIDRL